MDIKVEMKFQCKICNTIIDHNYTQSDVLNKSSLELTCQNCGNTQSASTSELIEKAKQSAIEEIKKHFKTK
jgi:transcription elongation factor Elf1